MTTREAVAAPKVSIVFTSYNHEPFLRQALDSVINQTYENWELLIWDDVSSDDSWNIIQSYTDPRIRSFRNDRTRRYIYAINQSITTEAKGEYIAIHHSDDAWHPDKLAEQVAYLDSHEDKAAVFTHVQLIDENNRPLENDWFNGPEQSREQWLRCLFMNHNKLCHPSVLVRRVEYIRAGLYKLVHAQIDDAEMWTRLLLHADIHVLPKKLTLHRIFSTGSNVSGDSPQTRARLQFEWFEQKKNYLDLSIDDILKIFPESQRWFASEGDSDRDYVLAMVAIHLGHCQNTRLFGLDLLYRLLNEPERAEIISQVHGFDYLNFMQLSGQSILFAVDEGDQGAVPGRESVRFCLIRLCRALSYLLVKR